jgi:ATP-dependent Clp protease adaptor protein ClpS
VQSAQIERICRFTLGVSSDVEPGTAKNYIRGTGDGRAGVADLAFSSDAPGRLQSLGSGIDVAMLKDDIPERRVRLANDDRKNKNDQNGTGTAVVTKTRPATKRPNLYRVLLLNDDYTPMEFVVHVLERFFNKDHEAAQRIMMHVHQQGIGECGVFTYEVAETKVTQVMDFARKHQHPLQCIMEKK